MYLSISDEDSEENELQSTKIEVNGEVHIEFSDAHLGLLVSKKYQILLFQRCLF